MASMTSWVHRYTPRELMDDTFDLFKERALDLLIAGLIPGCLIVLYWVLVRTFVFPGNLLTEFSPEKIRELLTTWQFWVYIYTLPTLVVMPTALSLALILQCRVAVRHILGDGDSVASAFRLLAKPFFSLFIVSLIFGAVQFVALLVAMIINMFVMGIFVAIGGIFLVASSASGASAVAGYVFMAIGYAVGITVSVTIGLGADVLFLAAPVSLAYEHAGPFKAIGQSFSFAMANFKSHFLALLVIVHAPIILSVLLLILGAAVYVPLQNNMPLSFEIILSLLGLILVAGCTGLLACLQSVIYLDGRCRRDALDLQLLAAGIGLGETFARLYTHGARMPQVQYPNYTGQPQPGLPGQPIVLSTPNYTAFPPTGAGLPPNAYPDYSAPPPATGASSAPVATAYPDYSAPPPAPGAGPFPAASVYPDYSAPPPPLEPADAPPAMQTAAEKPAVGVEPAGEVETATATAPDEQREDADVP